MSLVLSRKEGDSVILLTSSDEVITLTPDILESGRATLTFDAPKSVKILRAELLDLDFKNTN